MAERRASSRRKLMVVCQEFPPSITPTGNRAASLISRLSERWEIEVLTRLPPAEGTAESWTRTVVRPLRSARVTIEWLRRVRLSTLIELLAWPDEHLAWALPALATILARSRRHRPDVLMSFSMPHSSALVAALAKRWTGIPTVIDFDDSPTCSDMQPDYPTLAHARATRAFEDACVRTADATVYVSGRSLARVRTRLPEGTRSRLHLLRYGSERQVTAHSSHEFRVVYVGGFTGWHAWRSSLSATRGVVRRAAQLLRRAGRHEVVRLDHRSSSPIFVAQALRAALDRLPRGPRAVVATYGNSYPTTLIDPILDTLGLSHLVDVQGPIEPARVPEVLGSASALLITLPSRMDGSPGERISAKTYECLASDLPILAAVPPGESRDYLAGAPGVHVVDPQDVEGMVSILAELIQADRDGRPRRFDRSRLWPALSYDTRAKDLDHLLSSLVPG